MLNFAAKKCNLGHDLQVLNSFGGYYVGTTDSDGDPYCRLSGYYKDKQKAQVDLSTGDFDVRYGAVELVHCNCRYLRLI